MTGSVNNERPGGQTAVAAGCICPKPENNFGRGERELSTDHPMFLKAPNCPVHGIESGTFLDNNSNLLAGYETIRTQQAVDSRAATLARQPQGEDGGTPTMTEGGQLLDSNGQPMPDRSTVGQGHPDIDHGQGTHTS